MAQARSIEQQNGILDLLKDRCARSYHAVNLLDFKRYLELGAIPSRSLLASQGSRYTRFFSDARDVELGVWDHVFLNLLDCGNFFWTQKNKNTVPNAFGPITFVMNHDLWSAVGEPVVRSMSITSSGTQILAASDLSARFGKPQKGGFCSVIPNKGWAYEVDVAVGKLSISGPGLAYVLVDPVEVQGAHLLERVRSECSGCGWLSEGRVLERKCSNDARRDLMRELVKWSAMLGGRLLHTNESLGATVPRGLSEWLKQLSAAKQRALASWLTYFFNGTLLQI